MRSGWSGGDCPSQGHLRARVTRALGEHLTNASRGWRVSTYQLPQQFLLRNFEDVTVVLPAFRVCADEAAVGTRDYACLKHVLRTQIQQRGFAPARGRGSELENN